MLSPNDKPTSTELPFHIPAKMAAVWIMSRDIAWTIAAGPGGSIQTLFNLAWRFAPPQRDPELQNEPESSASLANCEQLERSELTDAEISVLTATPTGSPKHKPAEKSHPLLDAIRLLATMTRAGRLNATAMRDGQRQPMRSEDWDGLTLDIIPTEGGTEVLDVCRITDKGPIRHQCEWTEVHFERDGLLRLFPAVADPASKVTKALADVRRLQKWIEGEIRLSPNKSLSKRVLADRAREAGHNVSGAAFARARANAIKEVGAAAWSQPGRKPKGQTPGGD